VPPDGSLTEPALLLWSPVTAVGAQPPSLPTPQAPRVTWPNDLPSANRLRRIAIGTIPLVLFFRRWVHRRIEEIEFIDESRLRRHLSIDFTLPNLASVLPGYAKEPIQYVPLGFFAKAVLRDFDLRDESGMALPVLTRRTTQAINIEILIALAEQAVSQAGGSLDADARNDLRRIVVDSPDAAGEALSRVRTRFKSNALDALSADLSQYFIMFVPLPGAPERRRILKLAWEETYSGPNFNRIFRLFARFARFHLVLASIGNSASYHVEIQAPEELMVQKVAITRNDLGKPGTKTYSGGRPRFHLYIPDASRGSVALATLYFGLEPIGLLETAIATAVALGAGLAIHFWLHGHLVGESASAILIAIPGLLAAYIVRPGEHRMVHLFGARYQLAMVLCAAISFIGAGSLAVAWHPAGLKPLLWLALFAAAAVISVWLQIDLWRARRSKSEGAKQPSPTSA
jgi:hypothetical protein